MDEPRLRSTQTRPSELILGLGGSGIIEHTEFSYSFACRHSEKNDNGEASTCCSF